MSDPVPPRPLHKAVQLLASGITWLMLSIGLLWSFGALWFDFPITGLRQTAAVVFGLAVVAAPFLVRPSWHPKLILAMAIIFVLSWWSFQKPRQNRDWKPEVAVTTHAEIDGDLVTIHNVRHFEYRSETDFTRRYETRRFDLGNLRGVDMFLNYWGSPYMAHPILSFDFGADGRICFSIETRPEKGESYSALGGIYRQFELIYVVADERDVIRLRTNHRKGEDVYLYRLNAPHARDSFMEYIHTINELHRAPRWYNAVTNNCTTAIRQQRSAARRAPWDWRMLVNGYGDQLLYERGAIDRSLAFSDLRKISHINERARKADQDAAFSEIIRAGLPGMKP